MISIESHARLFASAGWTIIEKAYPDDLARAVEKVAIESKDDVGILREGTSSGGGHSKYWVLDGSVCHHLFPGLFDWYWAQIPLLSKIAGRQTIVSPFLRSAINVKIYEGDCEQGWHYDTNPFSAILYLSEGGAPTTVRDQQDYVWDFEPQPGRLLLMKGRDLLHRVDQGDKTRVTAVLNYYHPDDCERPEWIDRAIYGNEDPPRLT